MKKANKIRKMVTRIFAGVIFACLLVVTLQISFQGSGNSSRLSLAALTFGLFQPAMAATGGQGHCGPGQIEGPNGACSADPNTLLMRGFSCSGGGFMEMCVSGGPGCDVQGQTTCN
jgi:hypothetical protein